MCLTVSLSEDKQYEEDSDRVELRGVERSYLRKRGFIVAGAVMIPTPPPSYQRIPTHSILLYQSRYLYPLYSSPSIPLFLPHPSTQLTIST